MKYYTATRGQLKSPEYHYFNSVEEINSYYVINSTKDDYNKGYCFEYNGKNYLLGGDFY